MLYSLLFVLLFSIFFASPVYGAEFHFHALTKEHEALLNGYGLCKSDSPGVWHGNSSLTRAVAQAGVHVEIHDTRASTSAYEGYHSNEDILPALRLLAEETNGEVQHVGASTNGLSIDAVRLGPRKPGAPRVAFMAGIHGDEVVGCELVLGYARHLIDNDPTGVLESMEVYLLPRINPYGFSVRTRWNQNTVDLNRNFPDQFMGENSPDLGTGSTTTSAPRQPETAAVMNWMLAHKFHLAVVLHGGSVVCNYPYDGNADHETGEYTGTPDDAIYRSVCKAWASLNPEMMGNYLFDDGSTNGADWYVLYGGLQDWAYITMNTISITTEVSRVKWPLNQNIVARYGPNNFAGMSAFAKMAFVGIRGRLLDQRGNPHAGTVSSVDASGRTLGFASSADSDGYYVRLLSPGVVNLVYAAPGCTGKRITFTMEEGASFVYDITLQC